MTTTPVTVSDSSQTDGPEPLTIAESTSWFGPNTARTSRRAAAIWAAIALCGSAAGLLRSPRAKVLGAGLVLPGGGYLAQGRPLRALGSLLATVLGTVGWFVTGNVAIPPLVWLITVVRSARRMGSEEPRHVQVVPAVAAGVAATAVLAQAAHHRRLTATAVERNTYLRSAARPLLLGDRDVAIGPELSDFEVGLSRTLLDRALQPIDEWDGYTRMDQFREAGLRYQLTGSQWAFAMQQFCRTPALGGYLTEAQRRTIVKQQERKVWGYWFWENLWGNGRFNADPIRHQNVMFSGFLGLSFGLFETTAHDFTFSREPLELVWHGGKTYRYDFDALARAVRTTIKSSNPGWSMSACEPGWLYLVCNTNSIETLQLHDRLHGTSYADEVMDDFVASVEREFVSPGGRVRVVRSARLGFGLGPSVLVSDALMSVNLRPYAPVVADRLWAIMREEFLGDKGPVVLRKSAFDYTDPGNYGRNPVGLYANIIGAAKEVGDDELAQRALDELFELSPPQWSDGRVTFDGASVFHHAYLLRSIMGVRGSFLDSVRRGMPQKWIDGPRIESAPYPDIIVTRAVSDGTDLDVVLQPGSGPVKRAELGLTQLLPRTTYLVEGPSGGTVTSDDTGAATLHTAVTGRTAFVLRPQRRQ